MRRPHDVATHARRVISMATICLQTKFNNRHAVSTNLVCISAGKAKVIFLVSLLSALWRSLHPRVYRCWRALALAL